MRAIILFFLTSLSALSAAKPNIIVIISDDAGYADWGFMDDFVRSLNPGQTGSPVPTPNLNALRNRGTLFTNAYTAAVCSPSRAALVTGSYQQRIGYEYNINNLMGATAVDGLSPDTITIFDRMGAEGYTTGAVGKWHLGARANDNGLGNRPENQGVDEFFGIWKGSRNYTIGSVTGSGELRETTASPFSDTVLETTPPWNTSNNYVTNAFGTGAVNFIKRHHADEDPFFLYVSFTAPHSPIGPSPDINDPRISSLTGTRKNYASMVLTMDKEIGRILNTLDDPAGNGSISIADNTLVIFINDNGGANNIGTINTPLRDFKGSVYEGGTRVPMLIAGPGLPENATFEHPVHSIDILPTCLEASGAVPPEDIDGVSLIPHLTGATTDPPHDVIVIRNGSRYSVRQNDWKLFKNSNAAPSLFNLADDIGETTNLADTHPEIVTSLLHELTHFEAGSDKPRHAGLNNSPDSINLNDRFIAAPRTTSSQSLTPDLILVGGSLKNGDFNAGGGGGVQTFAQTPIWENIGSGTQNENTSNTSLSLDGSRNAIIAETAQRRMALDTGHTLSPGELFQTTFSWRDASLWNDATDRVRVTLFTTSDDTLNGTPTVLENRDSSLSLADSSYQNETLLFTGIPDTSGIPASANGKRLFVALDAAQSGNGFARLDNFTLVRGTLNNGPTAAVFNWSDSEVWIDPQTNLRDTLLALDSFPGAILEFPTNNTFSYTAVNDMTRVSNQTFMLNQLVCSGDFSGEAPRMAQIQGRELLFTRDLNGTSPTIALDSTGSGFSFEFENDLILYDDLEITGNGSSIFEIAGIISDYLEPAGVEKKGTSRLLLTTSPDYTGPTTITGGLLSIGNEVNLSTTPEVHIGADGTLGGTGTVSVPVTGPGTIAPGLSIGTLTTTDNVVLGQLKIEIDETSSDLLSVAGQLDITGATLDISTVGPPPSKDRYQIATYGTLSGAFETVTGLPSGYVVDYLTTPNAISLTRSDSAYQIWAGETHGLKNDDAEFESDPDGDLISNGIEFLTGTDPKNPNSSGPLSFTASENSFYITLPLSSIAESIQWQLEFSTDLETWSPEPPPTILPISLGIEEHFYRAGLSRFSINYPFNNPGKLFIRLKINQ